MSYSGHCQNDRMQADRMQADRMRAERMYVEQFTSADLVTLRRELLQSGVDSFQAAEIVTSFLSDRGYGVSQHEARAVASRIEVPGCTVEYIQRELERVALAM